MLERLSNHSIHIIFLLFSMMTMWLLVFVIGLGGTYDSSRYLFFASQFADYGNTYSLAYAPLFPFSIGFLQALGLSVPAAIFILFSAYLSITLSSFWLLLRYYTDNTLLLVLGVIALLTSHSLALQAQFVLTELGFGAMLTAAMYLTLQSIQNNRVSWLLLLTCGLLPLQRYIGISSANICLFITCFFLAKPLSEKGLIWLKSMVLVNTPLFIVSLVNHLLSGGYFGPRKHTSQFDLAENIQKLLQTFSSAFTIESVSILIAILATIFFGWKLYSTFIGSLSDFLQNPLQILDPKSTGTKLSLVLLISSLLIIGHVIAQLYSSSNVSINAIGPRYFISFEAIFLVQIIATMLFLGRQIPNQEFSWISTGWCILLLCSFPIQAYKSFYSKKEPIGVNPRSFGSRNNSSLSLIINLINESPGEKHIGFYENAKIHMPVFYLEMGLFDPLSPNCQGVQLLLPNINHFTPHVIAAPSCPDGAPSANRFYLMTEISSDDRFTHLIVSKSHIDNKDVPALIERLGASGFTAIGPKRPFMLFEKHTPSSTPYKP